MRVGESDLCLKKSGGPKKLGRGKYGVGAHLRVEEGWLPMNIMLAIFVTGMTGQSVVFATVTDERLQGADVFGTKIDGSFQKTENGFAVNAEVTVPPGVEIVQGILAPDEGLKYKIVSDLPDDYEGRDFVRLETEFGPIHARFQVLREII